MIIAGITGGIGSGKSVVSALLRVMGYPVYDSDREAGLLLDNDGTIHHALLQHFGQHVFSLGKPDRVKLAALVFNDAQSLKELNEIIHPAVKRHLREWAAQQSAPLVFMESAILFESGFGSETHKNIVVTAPEQIRAERVMRRDNTTREKVMQRINNQWPEERKLTLADYIIRNDDRSSLIGQTESIVSNLLA
jgi:dephospho-CoA kinase